MRRARVVVPLAAAAAALAGGGYALAAGGFSDVTLHACLNGGKLNNVQVTGQPGCSSSATPVNWPGQASLSASPSPTPTTPSPTPTTPSPSPTTTGAACVTSDPSGGCGAYLDPDLTNSNGYNTYVDNNVWNDIPGTSQTLTAYSPGDWAVSASMPAGNGAVVSYPQTQQLYTTAADNPDPLSGFASLDSTFTETMPHGPGTIAEAAWDLWTNYPSDIMVWTDTAGRCNTGAFGSTSLGTATIGGQAFDVHRYGGAGAEIIFVLEGAGGAGTCAQESSGSVDLLAVLRWVNANVTPVTGLSQADFGFEICSTGGTAENFSLSSYTLTDTCAGGGSGCQT